MISRHANVLLIIVATFVIHSGSLDRFWLEDDPQVLLHATRYGPVEVVTVDEAWQELSTSNFTPLVTWSFDLDLALFGLDPQLFYAHQLLIIALVGVALRLLLLAIGVGSRLSLLAVFLFLIAPPTIHVARFLMTRHYVEGLLAATLSLLVWVIAGEPSRKRPVWVLASAAAYLVSLLAKEVFLFLPLVALAYGIGRTEWRRLLVSMIPFGAAGLFYAIWRISILGSAGGYGDSELVAHLARAFFQWLERDPASAVWLVALVVVCLAFSFRSRLTLIRTVLIAAAVVAPLAGIGDALEPRHLLFPATVALCGAMISIEKQRETRWRTIMVVTVVSATLFAALILWTRDVGQTRKMEAEGRYVWDQRDDAMTMLAGSPGWYLEGLAELDRIWRDESSPVVIYSPLGIFVSESSERFLSFSDEGSPLVMSLEEIDVKKNLFRADAALEVEIERHDHELRWRLGPKCECDWRFYSYPEYQMFVVPGEGERIVPRPREQQWFRIERRESSGAWTLSPPLPLPAKGEVTRWKRETFTE